MAREIDCEYDRCRGAHRGNLFHESANRPPAADIGVD
jgi:hypothetical protein